VTGTLATRIAFAAIEEHHFRKPSEIGVARELIYRQIIYAGADVT
jgi:hypothetical protein